MTQTQMKQIQQNVINVNGLIQVLCGIIQPKLIIQQNAKNAIFRVLMNLQQAL